MSGIRGKNTKLETLVRSQLHRQGFRFRLHVKELPGKPDIVLPKYRAVIFVHGCFWHGHDCDLFRIPGSRSDFWQSKIERNRERDCKAKGTLISDGWRVAVVWECALRGAQANIEHVTQLLCAWLRSDETEIGIRK